nr:AAA family ATPase [Micromonospora sp. DSM 115978]
FVRAADENEDFAIVDLPRWLFSNVPFLAQTTAVLLAVLIPLAIGFWLVYRGGATVYPPAVLATRYRDVRGQDRVLSGVRDRVQQLAFRMADATAADPPAGPVSDAIVLFGPAGTGKNLIAAAVAGETSSALLVVDLAGFVPARSVPGVGRLKVASLFRRARRLGAKHGSVVVLLEQTAALDDDRGGTLAALSAELSPSTRRRPSGPANRLRQGFGAPCLPARYWTLLV